MREFKPPALPEIDSRTIVIFLAGSIDMGAAADWQTEMLSRFVGSAAVAMNPRRDDWDSSWRQSIADPRFRAQVEWELDGLERADVIAMWFERSSQSPITLLELGLQASSGKVIVGCPPGFWRRGNIEVVCDRFGIPLLDTFEDFVAAVQARLEALMSARG